MGNNTPERAVLLGNAGAISASVATMLTATFANEEDAVDDGAEQHGEVRAQQGFDVAEVVREYAVLRNVLLAVLEPDLNTGSVTEVLTAIHKINHSWRHHHPLANRLRRDLAK